MTDCFCLNKVSVFVPGRSFLCSMDDIKDHWPEDAPALVTDTGGSGTLIKEWEERVPMGKEVMVGMSLVFAHKARCYAVADQGHPVYATAMDVPDDAPRIPESAFGIARTDYRCSLTWARDRMYGCIWVKLRLWKVNVTTSP